MSRRIADPQAESDLLRWVCQWEKISLDGQRLSPGDVFHLSRRELNVLRHIALFRIAPSYFRDDVVLAIESLIRCTAPYVHGLRESAFDIR